MRILFVNQAYMKFYQGSNNFDHPENGGSWVPEHGDDCADACNFLPRGAKDGTFPIQLNDGETLTLNGSLCMAYISTMRTKDGTPKKMHLENIRGCQGCTKSNYVDDVLVVFCAKRTGDAWPTVVGWYHHAYVFRYYLDMIGPDGEAIYANIIAKAKDVVLLPQEERKWRVYRATKDGFGFGESNYWFANESQSPKVKGYVEDIVKKIEAYYGDNLVDYRLCMNCGSILPREVKYCDQCGMKLYWDANGDAWMVSEETMNPFFDFARFVLQGAPELSDEERKALREANYIGAAVSKGHGEAAAEDAAEVATNDLLLVDAEPKAVLLIVSANEKRLDAMEVQEAKTAVERFFQKKPLRALLCGAMLDKTLKDDQVRVTLIACE